MPKYKVGDTLVLVGDTADTFVVQAIQVNDGVQQYLLNQYRGGVLITSFLLNTSNVDADPNWSKKSTFPWGWVIGAAAVTGLAIVVATKHK